MTLDVSKFDKSTAFNLEHPLNNDLISFTEEVFIFSRTIFSKFEQL